MAVVSCSSLCCWLNERFWLVTCSAFNSNAITDASSNPRLIYKVDYQCQCLYVQLALWFRPQVTVLVGCLLLVVYFFQVMVLACLRTHHWHQTSLSSSADINQRDSWICCMTSGTKWFLVGTECSRTPRSVSLPVWLFSTLCFSKIPIRSHWHGMSKPFSQRARFDEVCICEGQ